MEYEKLVQEYRLDVMDAVQPVEVQQRLLRSAIRATPARTSGPESPCMRRVETYGGAIPGLQLGDLSGWLIVVEGTDGVGRTTHIDLLRAHLERSGYAVAETGLTRSDLASRGIRRAKQGNTLGSNALQSLLRDRFRRPPRAPDRAGAAVRTS